MEDEKKIHLKGAELADDKAEKIAKKGWSICDESNSELSKGFWLIFLSFATFKVLLVCLFSIFMEPPQQVRSAKRYLPIVDSSPVEQKSTPEPGKRIKSKNKFPTELYTWDDFFWDLIESNDASND